MKKKDLVKLLENIDPEATVIVQTSNTMEQGQSLVEVKGADEYKTGKKETKRFRDEFDDEDPYYNSEVWNISGGKESVVLIRG